MSSTFPPQFADLEPFAGWAVPTERARYAKRLASTMDELQAFYDAAFPRLEARERGVVERLELVHRAGDALGVALALGRQCPVAERFEVRELGGERDRCGGHTGTSRWYSFTYRRAV